MIATRSTLVLRQALASLLGIVIACPVFASGINQVYSWQMLATESAATCKSTRNGDLLVYTDSPLSFSATLFKRAKEKGRVLIESDLEHVGHLDTSFFDVRGTMKQLVYANFTFFGWTYQLYDVKPGPVTTPVGAFTMPALVSFGVTYFSKGAGALEVVAVNGSNIMVRVRTYDRKFAPLLDQQVTARRQYTAKDDIIMSTIAVFQEDGKYLRVLNGTDPVSGVPRFTFYAVSRTKLTPVAAPSLLSRLAGDGIGPFVYPVCTNGAFYIYDKTALKTIAGPFPIPGTTSNDVFGASWVFGKPVQKPLLAALFPWLENVTPAADTIALGVTSVDGYSLRSYKVTATGAQALARTAGIVGMASCGLYGRSFLLVQTNGTGSIVHKFVVNSLKEQAAQPCTSATPAISDDGFFVDESVEGIHRTVTVWKY